jgi:acyl dehydratase
MSVEPAPKNWCGRFFEDFDPGDVFRSRIGRTISEADNVWFTCLTMNTNQVHFNAEFAAETRFGKPLVNSCLTLSLVTGLSVADTSENGTANLSWTDIELPNPVSPATPSGPSRRSSRSGSHGPTLMSGSSPAHPRHQSAGRP